MRAMGFNDAFFLDEIAMQCPRTGGVAVFIARNFVRLLNIELEYDDDSNCASSSRSSSSGDKLNHLDPEFKISPNPTQSRFTLRGRSSSFIHQVILIDLNGKEIIKYLVNEKITEKTFDLPNLNDGVYNVKIVLENGASINRKIVILY
jgi:hypothetical protein